MIIQFTKYQATGNDFIIINCLKQTIPLQIEEVKFLCHRRYGVGADGLIILKPKEHFDFEMVYFNADGKEGSLCANGSRCIAQYFHNRISSQKKIRFWASDGEHIAEVLNDNRVKLQMKNIATIQPFHNDYLTDTGSPHYIKILKYVSDVDVTTEGKKIRFQDKFKHEGINVNFVEKLKSNEIFVRTYERGVENETLSCGTGVTAAALQCYHKKTGDNKIKVKTLGGDLTVLFCRHADGSYTDIWLLGRAEEVFRGKIDIPTIAGS